MSTNITSGESGVGSNRQSYQNAMSSSSPSQQPPLKRSLHQRPKTIDTSTTAASTTTTYPLPAYLRFVPGGISWRKSNNDTDSQSSNNPNKNEENHWYDLSNYSNDPAMSSPSKAPSSLSTTPTSSGTTPTNSLVGLGGSNSFGSSTSNSRYQRGDSNTSLGSNVSGGAGSGGDSNNNNNTLLTPDIIINKAKIADQQLRKFILFYNNEQQQQKKTTESSTASSLPPHYMPSLSILANEAFGSLTGVPPDSVKRWADCMVLLCSECCNDGDLPSSNIEEKDQEVVPTCEEELYEDAKLPTAASSSSYDPHRTVVSVLKQLLEKYENESMSGDSSHSGKHGGGGTPFTPRTRPCGYVFQRGDIAWNCRTCQTDSTCVLCDNCFRNSNHDGHEVFFHRTTPGGCCDCGDAEAWKVDGCCPKHRPNIKVPSQTKDQHCVMIPSEGAGTATTTASTASSSSCPGDLLLDETEEAVRMSLRGVDEGIETLTTSPTKLPPKLAAALGVVIGAAVQCLINAANGAGIGSDPVQWKLKWTDDACRIWNCASNNESYYYNHQNKNDNTNNNIVTPHVLLESTTVIQNVDSAASRTVSTDSDASTVVRSGKATQPIKPPPTTTTTIPPKLAFPPGYKLHLRLHNDDVHTFEEVIDALHETPRSSRARNAANASSPFGSLVENREDADSMTHHVDSDGQVIVKHYNSPIQALQGYKRLKSRGLHCSAVSTSQIDLELRAKELSSWLTEISSVHPSVAVLVVHALVHLSSSRGESDATMGKTTTTNSGSNIVSSSPIHVWNEARTIPSWAGLNDDNDMKACQRRFRAFPPHLPSSYVTREEAEKMHYLGLQLDSSQFIELTGTDPTFYSDVPYRLPSERYCKSPHALWGTLPSVYSDTTSHASKHPLLYRIASAATNDMATIIEVASTMENRLTEDVLVVDTDLRKQQEADKVTQSVYPHKLPGLHMISGLGVTRLRSVDENYQELPNPMHFRHLLATCSFRAPMSPVTLLLLLDPYTTKQLRASIHALFLSLLIDSRFKCRFAAALGGVAYRPLSTLFCAGVGTEADSPLGFTVQIFTAGSLIRALGNATATEKLLQSDYDRHNKNHNQDPSSGGVDGVPVGIFTLPIAHTVVRCIHTNLLGATKEVFMLLNNTSTGNDDDSTEDLGGNDGLLPSLTYIPGEHPLTTLLPAAPDDGFLDSRSTRHKRLPHILRDLEYVIETPGTAIRLLLPQKFPIHPSLPFSSQDSITFPTVWARLLRLAQGMDPQKRKISGGHVEYEQNRWLEAFGLSLNFAGTRDALSESPTNSSSATYIPVSEDGSHLISLRDAMGNLFAALLRELKLWLYREGMLETGLPVPLVGASSGMDDLKQQEALQRSTLHVSSSQLADSHTAAADGFVENGTSVAVPQVNAVALSCATGVKMTEAQLELIESALRVEDAQHQQRISSAMGNDQEVARSGPLMGDWLRVPHSPMSGDSLSFHLPLHRALAKSVRSLCSVVVPESVRAADHNSWWKLPVLDGDLASDVNSARQHPLAALIRPTLRSANCRVVWSAGPDCTTAEAQKRRSRSKNVSAAIASAKIIHSIADHPIRCLAASLQIERHLWIRNGSSTAGMALNYSSSPLCRSFRDLDLTLVQLSAAGLSIGLGARRVFALLITRFSMDGYLCDPERRINQTSPSGSSYGTSIWVNPPRLADADHAVALSESFFTTMCHLVTELPAPPPVAPNDDAALKASIRRELLHALAAEPKPHSEAMAAASSAVSKRDDNDNSAGSSAGAVVFREVFAKVLNEIGLQKNQSSSRASSGPQPFELKAECCNEYDPTFFHLRRHEHQHAMDTIVRLRRQKAGNKGGAEAQCIPIVCAPPKAHPRFLPCRLLLHLPSMDAGIRRSLLFALTAGSWLPPPEPLPPSPDDADGEGGDDGNGNVGGASSSPPPVVHKVGSPPIPVTTFGRRSFNRSSSSSFAKRSSSFSDGSEIPFSSAVVASSSVSFLEVLQLLTLQVHTLEECASLHRMQPDLDEEAKALSSSLSINSYLARLTRVPESLVDVWALRPFPDGPLDSKGSGQNRGSALGLLIALYEHRADHGRSNSSGSGSENTDDGHGGARTLTASGLKWLLRFVHALVDGASSVGAACQSATSGDPIRSATGSTMETATWTINVELRETIRGMLRDLPDLWPKEESSSPSGEAEAASAKSKEARKAAQKRVMEMMMKKQKAFAAHIGSESGPGSDSAKLGEENEDEADLCIICRCDDGDGENNGPLGYLGHVQRSRSAQMRVMTEGSTCKFVKSERNNLFRTYRVVGDHGCQLRATEAMDSTPLACLPAGSIVTVLKSKVSDEYDLQCRRVLVRHVASNAAAGERTVTEGWASIQSSQGYVILSPLSNLCFTNTRWGSTRPIIRQCGHAAHLQCVEAHTLSLHQRAAGDQPYDGRFAANIDDGEFLCPLCKQLSNILVPRDLSASGKAGTMSQNSSMNELTDTETKENEIEKSKMEQHSSGGTGGIRRLLCRGSTVPECKEDEPNAKGQRALRQFGAHLLQAMDVPWERSNNTAQKKKQKQWNPAIRRWDFEEDEGDEPLSSRPCVQDILCRLRQQHIAWASIGHSAASAEASTRSVEEALPFGVFSKTSDPWVGYNDRTRDTHPMLLELKRTLAATSGLLEVLKLEMKKHLGNKESFLSEEKAVSVVGFCIADILEGQSWMLQLPCTTTTSKREKALIVQWSELSALLSSTPCHTARDGMISPRHEARAVAAAMWAVRGAGTAGVDKASVGISGIDKNDPPAPLAIQKLFQSSPQKPSALPLDWGTMNPFINEADCESGLSTVPFRPAVASAFLYIPLLAWDMNTFAGAVFSTMLENDSDSLPSSEELLLAARMLLLGRMVQAIITPCGYDVSDSGDADEDEDDEHWSRDQIKTEGSALARIVAHCEAILSSRTLEFDAIGSVIDKPVTDATSAHIFGAISRAILPFARSLILLLRTSASIVRQRQRKQRNSSKPTKSDGLLDELLCDPEVLTYDDGFHILQQMGGPLPSQLLSESSDKTNSWWVLISKWLLGVLGLELHHGSGGKSIASQISSADDAKSVSAPQTRAVKNEGRAKEDVKPSFITDSAMATEAVHDSANLSVSMAASEEQMEDDDDSNEDVDSDGELEDAEDDEDMEDTQNVVNVQFFEGHNLELLTGAADLDDSDDDMMEEMEVDGEEEAIGFFEAALPSPSETSRRQTGSTNDFDDSIEGESPSPADPTFEVDKSYAFVSRAPILPFQPSTLGIEHIGPGPRVSSSFEYLSASTVMCDLSHLGMIHRKDSPTLCLIRLPRSFVELYGLVNRVKGRNGPSATDDADDATSTETAICLLTGTVMRSGSARRSYSRASRPPGACTLHARKVGSGIGIFFLVQKCTVLLMHNNKSAYSASLYVDEHGEEDPGLRRGRPLFLNEARYRALETLWRQQGIPREVAQIRSTSDRVIRDNWY